MPAKLKIPTRQQGQDDAQYSQVVTQSIREQRPYLTDDEVQSLSSFEINSMPKAPKPQPFKSTAEMVDRFVPKQQAPQLADPNQAAATARMLDKFIPPQPQEVNPEPKAINGIVNPYELNIPTQENFDPIQAQKIRQSLPQAKSVQEAFIAKPQPKQVDVFAIEAEKQLPKGSPNEKIMYAEVLRKNNNTQAEFAAQQEANQIDDNTFNKAIQRDFVEKQDRGFVLEQKFGGFKDEINKSIKDYMDSPQFKPHVVRTAKEQNVSLSDAAQMVLDQKGQEYAYAPSALEAKMQKFSDWAAQNNIPLDYSVTKTATAGLKGLTDVGAFGAALIEASVNSAQNLAQGENANFMNEFARRNAAIQRTSRVAVPQVQSNKASAITQGVSDVTSMVAAIGVPMAAVPQVNIFTKAKNLLSFGKGGEKALQQGLSAEAQLAARTTTDANKLALTLGKALQSKPANVTARILDNTVQNYMVMGSPTMDAQRQKYLALGFSEEEANRRASGMTFLTNLALAMPNVLRPNEMSIMNKVFSTGGFKEGVKAATKQGVHFGVDMTALRAAEEALDNQALKDKGIEVVEKPFEEQLNEKFGAAAKDFAVGALMSVMGRMKYRQSDMQLAGVAEAFNNPEALNESIKSSVKSGKISKEDAATFQTFLNTLKPEYDKALNETRKDGKPKFAPAVAAKVAIERTKQKQAEKALSDLEASVEKWETFGTDENGNQVTKVLYRHSDGKMYDYEELKTKRQRGNLVSAVMDARKTVSQLESGQYVKGKLVSANQMKAIVEMNSLNGEAKKGQLEAIDAEGAFENVDFEVVELAEQPKVKEKIKELEESGVTPELPIAGDIVVDNEWNVIDGTLRAAIAAMNGETKVSVMKPLSTEKGAEAVNISLSEKIGETAPNKEGLGETDVIAIDGAQKVYANHLEANEGDFDGAMKAAAKDLLERQYSEQETKDMLKRMNGGDALSEPLIDYVYREASKVENVPQETLEPIVEIKNENDGRNKLESVIGGSENKSEQSEGEAIRAEQVDIRANEADVEREAEAKDPIAIAREKGIKDMSIAERMRQRANAIQEKKATFEKENKQKNENTKASEQNTDGESGKSSGNTSQKPTNGKVTGEAKKRAKATIKNPTYLRALDVVSPDATTQVMQYFIRGGRVSPEAIKGLYKNAKGELRSKIGFIKKEAPSIDGLAHSLWEEHESMFGDQQGVTPQDFKNAIEDVLNSYSSRSRMAESVASQHIDSFIEREYQELEERAIAEAKEYEEYIGDAIDLFAELTEEQVDRIIAENAMGEKEVEQSIAKELAKEYVAQSEISELSQKEKQLAREEAKLSKLQQSLESVGKENQIDIFGDKPSDALLFSTDISDAEKVYKAQKKVVDGLKAEISEIKQAEQTAKDSEVTPNQIAMELPENKQSKRTIDVDGYKLTDTPSFKNGVSIERIEVSTSVVEKDIYVSENKNVFKEGVKRIGNGWIEFQKEPNGDTYLFNENSKDVVLIKSDKGGRMPIIVSDFAANNVAETKGTQSKLEQAASKIRDTAAKLREQHQKDLDDPNALQRQGGLSKKQVAIALEKLADIIDVVGDVEKAIKQFLEGIKDPKERKEYEKEINNFFLEEYGEKEPIAESSPKPKTKAQVEQETGEMVERTLVSLRLKDSSVDESVKESFSDSDKMREIDSANKAEINAMKLIQDVGLDEAVRMAKEGEITGAFQSAVLGAKWLDADMNVKAATTPEELSAAQKEYKEILSFIGKTQEQMGGANSYWGVFYSKNEGLGMTSEEIIARKIAEWEATSGKVASREIREKYEQLEKQNEENLLEIKKLREQLEQENIQDIIDEVKSRNKPKDPKAATKKAKEVADSFRETFKSKPIELKDADGNPILDAEGKPIVLQMQGLNFNELIEVGAKAIEKTGEIIDGLKAIGEKLAEQEWYKSLSKKDKDAVLAQISKTFKDKLPDVDTTEPLTTEVLKELVTKGYDTPELLLEKVKEFYPDKSERQVRDIITKYGQPIKETQTEISQKVSAIKSIWAKLSQIEDAKGGIMPFKRSAPENKQFRNERRRKMNELREAMKNLDVPEAEMEAKWQSRIEASKNKYKNAIADYEKAIKDGEVIVKNKAEKLNDKDIEELKRELELIKDAYNEVFGEEPMSEGEKKIKALEKQLEGIGKERAKTETVEPEYTASEINDIEILEKQIEARKKAAKLEGATLKTEGEKNIEKLQKRLDDIRFGAEKRESEKRELSQEEKDLVEQIKDEKAKLGSQKAKRTTEQIKIDAIDNAIDRVEGLIKNNDLEIKRNPKGEVSLSLKAKREAYEATKNNLYEARKEAGIIEAEMLRKRAEYLEKRNEYYKDRIKRGDFSKKERKKSPTNEKINKLMGENDLLKFEEQKLAYLAQEQAKDGYLKTLDKIADIWNIPRIQMATGELSFIGVQGRRLTSSYMLKDPKVVVDAVKTMVKAMGSKEGLAEVMSKIKNDDPTLYHKMKASKLDLTETSFKLKATEENTQRIGGALLWNLAMTYGAIPLAKGYDFITGRDATRMAKWLKERPFYEVFERGAVAYNNYLRAKAFVDFDALMQADGKDFDTYEKEYKLLADYLNTASGRAKLPFGLESQAELLSKFLFSPRNFETELELATTPFGVAKLGVMQLKSDTQLKNILKEQSAVKEAAKHQIRYTALQTILATSLTGLAYSMLGSTDDNEDGTGVELDPRSGKFGSITFENGKIVDFYNGGLRYAILASRIGSKEYKTADKVKVSNDKTYYTKGEIKNLGEGYVPDGLDLFMQIAGNKVNPALGASLKLYRAKPKTNLDKAIGVKRDKFGNRVDLESTFKEIITPIYYNGIMESLENDPTVIDAVGQLQALVAIAAYRNQNKEKKAKEEAEQVKKDIELYKKRKAMGLIK